MESAKGAKLRRNCGKTNRNSKRKRKRIASTNLPSLPLELVTEILLRLPARSVGRFRCVSKPFRSLLSDPKFAKKHVDLIHRNDVVRSGVRRLIVDINNLFWVDFDQIGVTRVLTAVELDYPIKEDMDYLARSTKRTRRYCGTDVIGSYNGLVCLCTYWNGSLLYLYNPTIYKSKTIPKLPKSLCSDKEVIDNETHGFGFDAMNDDYKVVKLVSSKEKLLTTNVYSLKSDSWRQISGMRYHNVNPETTGVYLNGALHWIAYLDGNERVVAAFDIKTEEFRDMSLPDEAKNCTHPNTRLEVGILKGCLCVSYNCNEWHEDIWVMNEYGLESSWTKIRLGVSYKAMKPVCLTKNNEEVVLVLDKHLVLYNFKCNTSRILKIYGVEFGRKLEATTYVESLVSPDSYGVE